VAMASSRAGIERASSLSTAAISLINPVLHDSPSAANYCCGEP
jgi:hypothetical protein